MPESVAGSLIAIGVVPMVMFGLAFAYLGLRFRDGRSDVSDPELGIKSAYYAFLSVGILLALSGLTIAVSDLLAEQFEGPNNQAGPPVAPFNPKAGPGFPQQAPMRVRNDDPFDTMSQRVAWPLVVSGVLVSLVSLLLARLGTNDAQFPSVRRTFGGFRLVVGGLGVVVTVTLLIELLFQKNLATTRPLAWAIGSLAIWFPYTAVQLFLLKRDSRLAYYVPPKPRKAKKDDDHGAEVDRAEDERPHRRRTEVDDRRERRATDDRDQREERRPPRRRPRDEEEEE
jgi:hypothetical protein